MAEQNQGNQDNQTVLSQVAEWLQEKDKELAEWQQSASELVDQQKEKVQGWSEEARSYVDELRAKYHEIRSKSPDDIKEEVTQELDGTLKKASHRVSEALNEMSKYFEDKSHKDDSNRQQ